MFSHDGLNAFICKLCGKGYSRKDRLTLHIKKEHDDES
jgi:uncharacterized Zn-finger protein